jgi:hypothetical protein
VYISKICCCCCWKHLWCMSNFLELVLTVKQCKFRCYFLRLCKWHGCTCHQSANRLFSLYLIFYLCTAVADVKDVPLRVWDKMAGCWMLKVKGIKIFVKVFVSSFVGMGYGVDDREDFLYSEFPDHFWTCSMHMHCQVLMENVCLRTGSGGYTWEMWGYNNNNNNIY